MSGLKLEDRLQQHFDGESDAAEARSMRSALDEDAELRAKLEGLSHLRVLLNVRTEALETELDSEALFANIEAKLQTSAPVNDDPMLVDAPLVVRVAPLSHPSVPPVRSISSAPKARRSRVSSTLGWISATGVLAAAAALAFVIWGGDERTPMDPVAAAPPPGSEVVEVDFGYSTGAIFAVEGQEGEHYAVVWVSDEKAESGEEERIQ